MTTSQVLSQHSSNFGSGTRAFRLVDRLNSGSARVLDSFAELGKVYNREDFDSLNIFGKSSSVVPGMAKLRELEVEGLVQKTTFPADYLKNYSPSKYSFGQDIGYFKSVAGLFDASTGVLKAAGTFAEEREAGSRNYPKTISSLLGSVGQITASAAAGAGTAALVSGALSGLTAAGATGLAMAAAPVVLGGAAALSAGYVVGKFVDFLSD